MSNKTFSFSTIENFDNHISKSISNYEHLHSLIKSVASFFIQNGCRAYDLGASSGLLVDQLTELHPSAKIIGIEKEANIIKSPNVENCDVIGYQYEKCSFVSSIFTLQFIAVEDRAGIIESIFNALNFGGAFIMAEKVYISSGIAQEVFTFSNYDYKSRSFTPDQILEKERDLRRIMKPLTKVQNEQMLKHVGFSTVELFYQSLNFCAWIAVK